ncbi:MAG: bifunctional aspartokinase / homoserine dehydrogenase 1 [Thermotogaceae bacterium]|jgi:aspartokinase/homoserine dehydrogenase 1|nr:bifunctional aspartokinase / homoserine dehydrogenase 1 [Thermotogaceae bacterium]
MRVGIAGLGTVGGAVYRLLTERSREIEERTGEKFIVSRVLNRSPIKYQTLNISSDLIASDFDDLIINSDVVVETIGGIDAAFPLVQRALELGKIVITANKNLISECGNELYEFIKHKKLFFEGAVGGGIPIISLLQDYLIFHKVTKIRGILNGTTNYILTEMLKGLSFEEALKDAQKNGYAEADPTNDIEGYDLGYKISVLAGIVTGKFPGLKNVKIEGISSIDSSRLIAINQKGMKLKLVGTADLHDGIFMVSLEEIQPGDPLYSVDGVENGVEVSTDLAGNFFLRGRGAGGNPTASAIIADLFRVAKYKSMLQQRRYSVVVMKFGGASVEDISKMKSVARKIEEKIKTGVKPVVVLSAMGDTTDNLIEMAKKASKNPDPRELDLLLSTGEIQSVALMSLILKDFGYKAISLTGEQLKIITNEKHGQARIENINTSIVSRYIELGYIPVVAGFQGIARTGDITTLGRGGSDLTAIALAHSIGADICELYKDVDGIFTADPRIVENTRPIKELSWEEMIELSRHGSQVLQARAAEFARKYGVKVVVKNFNSNWRGTLIWEGSKVEEPVVRAVTIDSDVVKVVLKNVPDKPGVAARIMRTLSQNEINIDMIIQSMREGKYNSIAFIMPSSELENLDTELLKERSQAQEVIIEKDISKVSVVGVNLTSTPKIAAAIFETLANEGINIDMISASNSRISVIISKESANEAVKAIHSRFDLDLR